MTAQTVPDLPLLVPDEAACHATLERLRQVREPRVVVGNSNTCKTTLIIDNAVDCCRQLSQLKVGGIEFKLLPTALALSSFRFQLPPT